VIELDAYLLAGSLHARFACFVCSGEEWIELKDDVSTFVLQISDVLNIQTRLALTLGEVVMSMGPGSERASSAPSK
jgi:hypothetical protein